MITINIVSVGNIKEKFYIDAINEYKKRLTRFCKINIYEVSEHKYSGNINESAINIIKNKEAENIKEKLQGYIVLLDIHGKSLDSEEFADFIEKTSFNSSTITFVIGGSHGVSDEIKSMANYKLSFSKFTYPHQLMRVVLTEQIYRAFTIKNNITYHK